jgi:ABC-type lipoprotein release transport system permease subunit
MAIPLKYNVRSLLVRRISTAMTAAGIALVVAVFVMVMAMTAGIGAAITDAGAPDNLVVIRRGATTETYSLMTLDQFTALEYLPGIRRDASGAPLASPELPVQTLLQRRDGGSENIVFRGVLPVALKVHDQVHLIQGRMFTPGLNEVIVGRGLVRRYANCSLGSNLHFGRGTWKVVGIFEARGSSFESEVWGDIHSVQDEARRGAYYACARVKLAPGAGQAALIRRIADDPRINLEAQSEQDYYIDEARVATQLRTLVLIVAAIMGVGAIFGAMNTMYAAVSARTAEIGTLRALGFSPSAVMFSFLAESLILALVAGVIGVLAALPVNGFSTTFGNFATFSSMAFSFRVTSAILIEALAFATIMGLLGGWLPARQAMRLTVVDALRRI